MGAANEIISLIRTRQNVAEFQELNWKGTFDEYLDLVVRNPRVTRSAFQRIYDMILSHGVEEYSEHKRKILRYRFFDDIANDGADAIYGLEQSLMKMVNIFKSAAQRYGTEKRILLLHGPVGSAKSTLVRLLKKGIENYSRTPEGALYTFGWRDDTSEVERFSDCPMHEEPLHLIPEALRDEVLGHLNEVSADKSFRIAVEGELCPACRFQFNELMRRYEGDWTKVAP